MKKNKHLLKNFTSLATLLFNLFLICAVPLLAADESEIILLKSDNDTYEIAKQARVFIDDDKSYTLEQILTLPESNFVSHKNFNFGLSKKAYWIKLRITPDNSNQDWLLEISHPVLDHVALYIPEDNGKYNVKKSGDALPFHNRSIKHRTFLFELPLKENQVNVFYIRVSSESTVSVPMKIWNEKAMTENRVNEQMVFGIYYGLIIAMALYNSFFS